MQEALCLPEIPRKELVCTDAVALARVLRRQSDERGNDS